MSGRRVRFARSRKGFETVSIVYAQSPTDSENRVHMGGLPKTPRKTKYVHCGKLFILSASPAKFAGRLLTTRCSEIRKRHGSFFLVENI